MNDTFTIRITNRQMLYFFKSHVKHCDNSFTRQLISVKAELIVY